LDSPVSTHLDGNSFALALVSGIHQVIAEQDFLNHINVFPVADGDTGTNLSLSLGATLAVLSMPGDKHLGTLLAAVADALLDGARGNSGAIVAQFFQGLSDAAGDLGRFTPYTFSKAVQTGSDYAHDAMSNPREGTILTVIADFAASLDKQVNASNGRRFPELLDCALAHIQSALAMTQEQLEVLRKAGVVDAGARGFVALVEGMTAYISNGEVRPEPDLSFLRAFDGAIVMAGSADDSVYRYCTECLVTGSDINRRRLREALSELGDSLVLAGTKRKAKVHLHANDPDNVFDICREYGTVSSEKADDMHRQAHSSHDRVSRFAVITDSTADIADEDMERLDIHMVPCRIQFGDRGYLDKVSITSGEFFRELQTSPHHPTTSQPSPGDIRRQFQFLASHFPDVLSINLTAAASGTFASAVSAAEHSNAPGRIHVVDSRNASLGQGLLAVFAAECAHAGLTIETTLAAMNQLIARTRTIGVLGDMKYAVRGGRLPGWVRSIADLLHVTPFIRTTDDGRIAASGFAFGTRDRTRKFARHIVREARDAGPLTIAIGHAACPEAARELESYLRDALPAIRRLTMTELGAGLGVHTGPGTLVIGMQPYTRPDDVR